MDTILILAALTLLTGGCVWLAIKIWRYHGVDAYDRKSVKKPKMHFQIAMTVIGLLWFIVSVGGGVVVIQPTEIGVVENRLIGQVYPLSSGTHVWPFSPNVVPLFTKTSTYSIRNQVVEIGETPKDKKPPDGLSETQAFGVPSSSDSPGMPVVFFKARGWAQVNLSNVAELHKRFGPQYLDKWVEQNWISTLKAAQSKHPFDYCKLNREALQTEVEEALQAQLEVHGPDGPIQLVIVSQLAIVDFDYSKKTNDFLDELLRSDYTRQQAIQMQLINTQAQAAEKISADTKYLVEVRQAEAQAAQAVAKAEGEARAIKMRADADAYAIQARYKAEAEGIQKVQAVLSSAPAGYLEYQKTGKWDGRLPMYILGNSPVPFMSLPTTTP